MKYYVIIVLTNLILKKKNEFNYKSLVVSEIYSAYWKIFGSNYQ